MVLHLFERPGWTYGQQYDSGDWMNTDIYPSYGLARCPMIITLPLSTILLLILAVGAYQELQYEQLHRWWSLVAATSVFLLVLVGLKILENVINSLIFTELIGTLVNPISFSPAEAIILLLVERRFVTNILYFGRILPKFSAIVVMLTVAVTGYAALSFVFFAPTSSERLLYFSPWSRGVWSMSMVLCGSNWPNPIIPAYSENRLSILYFFIFLVIFNWGVLNFVLGLLCSVYRDEQRELGVYLEHNRIRNLRQAFSILDQHGSGFVSANQLTEVLHCMYRDYNLFLTLPSIDERKQLIANLMNTKSDIDAMNELPPVVQEGGFHVSPIEQERFGFREFCRIHSACSPEALRIVRQRAVQEAVSARRMQLLTLIEQQPNVFHLLISLPLLPYYKLTIDGIIFLLGIVFLVSQHFWISVTMLVVQLADLVMTAHATSLTSYLSTNRGLFDLTYVLSVLLILFLLLLDGSHSFCNFLLSSVALVRMGVCSRSVFFMDSFAIYRQKFVQAFRLLALGSRNFSFLLTLLFAFMYAFADLGMRLFGGLVCREGLTGVLLSVLDYGTLGYWPVNLNDMFSALATMFLLLHVNNTHVYAEAFESLTGSAWARLFFAAWYVVGVLLLLNLFTAFFLNGFLAYLRSLDTRKRAVDLTLTQDSLKDKENTEEELLNATPPQHSRTTQLLKTVRKEALTTTKAKSVKLLERSRLQSSALSSDESDSDWLDEDSDDSSDDDEEARQPRRPLADFSTPNVSESEPTVGKQNWLRSKLKTLSRSISSRIIPSSDSSSYLSNFSKHLYGGFQKTTPKEEVEPLSSEISVVDRNQVPKKPLKTYGATTDINSNSAMQMKKYDNDEDNKSIAEFKLHRESDPLLGPHHSSPLIRPQESIRLRKYDVTTSATEHTSTSSSALPEMQDEVTEPFLRSLAIMRPEEVAAVLIQCARDGVRCEGFNSRRALLCFQLRHRQEWVYQACAWLHLGLFIVQQPLWMRYVSHQSLHKNAYPVFGCPYITLDHFLLIQTPLTCILLAGLLFETSYQKFNGLYEYITKSENICRLLLTTNCMLELGLTIGTFKSPDLQGWLLWSALFGITYVFWFDLTSRWKLEVVLRIVPRLIIVLIAFTMLVVLCASFGPFIFNIRSAHDDDDYNQTYFNTFPESVWSVFVAITSSSFPNQVMPLYRQYNAFILYIIAFVGVGAFGALNIILVFVLAEYRKGFDQFSIKATELREVLLLRAFDVLDTEQRGWLTYTQTAALFDELHAHYGDFLRFGNVSRRKRNLLTKILDIDGDGVISADDFKFLIDVTRIRLKQTSDATFLDLFFPAMRRTFFVQTFISFFQTKSADLVCDSVVLSLILIRLVLVPDIFFQSNEPLRILNLLLLVVFLIELLGGVCALGFKSYQLRVGHRVNATLTFVYISACLLSLYSSYGIFPAVLQGIVQVIRLIIFPRVVFVFFPDRMATVGKLLRKVIRRMGSLAVVLICSWYLFAVVGVYLFGGLVNQSTNIASFKALRGSVYGRNQFWDLNFNDMPSALVTLFCCLHVSDFDVITAGFVVVTNKFARVYFVAWYVVGVLLLLNIIKSFFLTEFLPTVVATLKPEETRGEQILVALSHKPHVTLDANVYSPQITPQSPQPLERKSSQTTLAGEYERSLPINLYSISPVQRGADDVPDDQSAVSFSFAAPSPSVGTPEAVNILNSIQSFTLYSNDASVLVDTTEGIDTARDVEDSERLLDRFTEQIEQDNAMRLVENNVDSTTMPEMEERAISPERIHSRVHSISPNRTLDHPASRSMSPMGSQNPVVHTRDHSPQPGRQSVGHTKRYEASTEFVSDLDAHDLQLLHERLRQISTEAQTEADDDLDEEEESETS